MISLGSVPDWLSVFIALIALLLFFIAERDKLGIGKRTVSNDSMGRASSADNEVKHHSLTEPYVDTRAGIYSRILIGIVFGIALGNVYACIVSGSFQDNAFPSYETELTMEWAVLAVSAIALSTLLSTVFCRAYASWTSTFVHWAERLALSFVGFGVIFLLAYFHYDYQAKTYHLYSASLVNVVMSSVMFLLIGFASTPVDWLIVLINKSRAGGTLSRRPD